MSNPSPTRHRDLWSVDVVGLGTCVLVTALVYFAGIAPLLEKRAAADYAKQKLAFDQESARERVAVRRQLNDELSNYRQALPESPVELQSAGQLNYRLSELIQLARSSGLQIDEVRPGDSTEGPHFRTIAIHLLARGTYQTCTEFLRRSGAKLRDLVVTNFDLKADPRKLNSRARCQIDLLWYTSPSKKGH